MRSYYETMVQVTFIPLLVTLIIMGWWSRKDKFWLVPGAIVSLLIILNGLLLGKYWSPLFAIGLYMLILGRLIVSQDTDQPVPDGVPSWAKSTPTSSPKIAPRTAKWEEAIATPTQVEARKPKGYHRPEAVNSRTQEIRMIES